MESKLTVTIFSDEYRELIKAKCEYDLLIHLLISQMELDYDGEHMRFMSGRDAVNIIGQFSPVWFNERHQALLSKKEAMLKALESVDE